MTTEKWFDPEIRAGVEKEVGAGEADGECLTVVYSRVIMKHLSGYHRLSKDYRRQHKNNDAA